jgi:hypothetical protein
MALLPLFFYEVIMLNNAIARKYRFLLGLALVFYASTLWAGPKEEMMASWEKFAAATSWKVALSDADTGQVISKVEFQAPNRWRINNTVGPITTVINGTAYVKMDGKPMQFPIGDALNNLKMYEDIRKNAAQIKIKSASKETLNGQATTKYVYTMANQGNTLYTAWIATRSGLVMRFQYPDKSKRFNVDYSSINDPKINIKAP